jgi:hypothetical protein
MSNQDDLKKLITDYAKRLQKLKEQKAIAGLSVDPKIPIEIEDIESEIESLQVQLREEKDGVSSISQTSVTTDVREKTDTLQELWWRGIEVHSEGDVIIGNVGAGASGVAFGKNVSQAIYDSLREPTPSDRQVIEQKFTELKTALQDLPDQLDAKKVDMAKLQVQLLQGELTKIEENETPSASAIILVGDWLLENLPEIADIIVSLFATPAVSRVVGKAGDVAIEWVKSRFNEK